MKTYIVLTKKGDSFQITATNLQEAKQTASFNCIRMKDKVDKVYLKKNKLSKIKTA